jgi:hypothetical protein
LGGLPQGRGRRAVTDLLLTVAYVTFRRQPRFEWFVASFMREMREAASRTGVAPYVQIIVVDGRLWCDGDARRAELITLAGGLSFEHVPPKPTPWQGPYRQTSKDYFAAASTRNTALALARGRHVAFVDDLSLLLPGWLKAHQHAAAHGYVLAGTTCKYHSVEVYPDGGYKLGPATKVGQDSRIPLLKGGDLQKCGGGWLFGGTFSVPLDYALRVNGQDEAHDSIGGEDYDFGIRLERAGCTINITRECGTIEDEMGHAETPMIRLDKPWAGPDGPYSSNLLLNRLQREKDRAWTSGNHFNLRELRDSVLAGRPFPQPEPNQRHWVDSQPLSEM